MHAQTHNYTHSARNQLMKMCVCVVSAMVFFFTKIKSICWETTKKMKSTTKSIKLEFYVCENEIRETNQKNNGKRMNSKQEEKKNSKT